MPLFRQVPHGEGTRLRDLLAGAWVPVIGLMLLFALQELHVIVVKHEADGDAAGSYAVAAVAAKAIIWVAVGLGMYLLPEAARRVRGGEDARPILLRTLALIAAVAVPMVLIYAVAAEPLLGAVFGDDLTGAAGALPWLGLAMALLACAYLVRAVPARDRAQKLHRGARGGRRRGGARPARRGRQPHQHCARAVRSAAALRDIHARAVAAHAGSARRRNSVSTQPLERPRGARRFVVLFRLWRREAQDPEPFYTLLAAEAAEDFERRYGPLRGQRIADVGCGPGFYTRALREHGADVIPVDNDLEELELAGNPPENAIVADATALPFEDGSDRRRALLEHAGAHARRRGGRGRARARASPRRLGLRVLDQLVLALGRAPHGALPLPRPAARPARVRAPARQAAQARLRRDAVGGARRADAALRARAARSARSSGWSRATGRGSRSSRGSRWFARCSCGTA